MEEEIEDFILYLSAEKGLSKTYQDLIYSTLKRFEKWIKKGSFSLQNIQEKHLVKFLNKWKNEKNLESSSIQVYISHLKIFFKWFCKKRNLSKNPTENLFAPKQKTLIPHFLSIEKIKTLLKSIDTQKFLGKRDKALIELLYGSGLRASEASSLKINFLNLEEKIIRILGKGGKVRILPLGKKAIKALEIYLNEERIHLFQIESPKYVFLNKNGKQFSRIGIYKMLKRRMLQSPLNNKIYPHMLRHSFATHMLENDSDIRIIQELLGHSDIRSTEIYTHTNQKRISKIHKKFHPRG